MVLFVPVAEEALEAPRSKAMAGSRADHRVFGRQRCLLAPLPATMPAILSARLDEDCAAGAHRLQQRAHPYAHPNLQRSRCHRPEKQQHMQWPLRPLPMNGLARCGRKCVPFQGRAWNSGHWQLSVRGRCGQRWKRLRQSVSVQRHGSPLLLGPRAGSLPAEAARCPRGLSRRSSF